MTTKSSRYDHIEEVEKFNPFHDELGRFSSADAGISFTRRTRDPAKQHWADMAMAREKERTKDWPSDKKKPANPLGDPEVIGGSERGEPMDRAKANSGNVNPDFKKVPGSTINCQSCVVAFEARLRGYDVKAKPNHHNSAAEHIAQKTNAAWIDPKTGKHPEILQNDDPSVKVWTQKKIYNWLESNVGKSGERYTFQHGWKTKQTSGHIISVDRDNSGSLRLYDPQTGRTYTGGAINDYLACVKATVSIPTWAGPIKMPRLGLTRVDNMQINSKYADKIMQGI